MVFRYGLFILLIINIINISKAVDSDLDKISDDMDKEEIYRRTASSQEWQYEGIPIEIPPSRRSMPKEENDIDITTYDPPLDYRYRRIYNADEVASIDEYPFLAALLVNNRLWCGGAIIDSDKILTAAHCLQLQYNNRFFREYVKMLSVRVGSSNSSSGGELYRVAEIFFHPNYKPNVLEFNMAVVRIHKNISFENGDLNTSPITYSTKKSVPVDSNVTFLGWGSVLGVGGTGGQVLLQKLELPVYDLSDCQEIYGRELVTRSNFCAGYITIAKNVCNHDAGGPAVMNGELIGILSFSSKRCDSPDKPAVFTSVGHVAEWIESLGKSQN